MTPPDILSRLRLPKVTATISLGTAVGIDADISTAGRPSPLMRRCNSVVNLRQALPFTSLISTHTVGRSTARTSRHALSLTDAVSSAGRGQESFTCHHRFKTEFRICGIDPRCDAGQFEPGLPPSQLLIAWQALPQSDIPEAEPASFTRMVLVPELPRFLAVRLNSQVEPVTVELSKFAGLGFDARECSVAKWPAFDFLPFQRPASPRF